MANGILNFLSTPGGSNLASGILSGIGSMGQGQRQDQLTQAQLMQQMAQMQQQNGQSIMGDQLTRDQAVNAASPLGWAQNYQQQQLAKNIGFQQLMGGSTIRPTDPKVQALLDQSGYKPFTPTMPDDWKNVNPFGAGQTMDALALRQNDITQLGGGRAPQVDFSQMGLDPATVARLQQNTGQFQQQAQGNTDANYGRLQEAINMSRNAVNQQQQQQQSGGGIGGFLGGLLKTAAPFASLIPGVGTLAGIGLGAAGSALGSKMQGTSVGQGLVQGGLGAGLMGAMKPQLGQAQGPSYTNPNMFQSPQGQSGLGGQMNFSSPQQPRTSLGGSMNFTGLPPQAPYNPQAPIVRQPQAPFMPQRQPQTAFNPQYFG